ncbi:MAG TPA: glycosyltransferase family 4 protein [Thermoanaerobaculia bacterium]|jgi:glycosyltransferase involved in cell wall biosynthesis|nr:glycosyltransferase family 4 protein [Thermoanaerobaculia bacterium]
MSARHVVFVNRFFHPDHSATSQMLSDLAFHLAGRGWRVEIVTSRQRYDDAAARLPSRETTRGVAVTRVWSSSFGRGFLPGRAVDYATFYASAFVALFRRTSRKTTIVALTDPPLISVVAALVAMLRGASLVNWTQDLFPEVAEVLGMRSLRVLRGIRNWSLRRARTNVAISESMAARLPKAVVIHNWADASLRPIEQTQDRFVIGYSGNLGRAHDASTMLAAMRELRDDKTIEFLVTGGGAQLDIIRNERLPNVRFAGYAPLEKLSESLSAADAHLVTLLPSLEGLIVPSKFYGILAVARPVLFAGSANGELARIIRTYDCGMVVESGDGAALARCIRELAQNPERARAMGQRGRSLYDEKFAPPIAMASWEKVLT